MLHFAQPTHFLPAHCARPVLDALTLIGERTISERMATAQPVGNGHANGACKIGNGTCSGGSSPLGIRSKQANGSSPCTARSQDSSLGSTPSDISSQGLLQIHQQGGFDAYLGSEAENVADIFGRSESSDDLQHCSSDYRAKVSSR